MNSKMAIPLLAAVALSACAQDYSTKVGRIDAHEFGEANRQTYAAMIIDPDPQYSTPLPTSAEHAAAAIDRYRKGTVKQPERASSTSAAAAGGGGSSAR
jgi:hypothetical protein